MLQAKSTLVGIRTPCVIFHLSIMRFENTFLKVSYLEIVILWGILLERTTFSSTIDFAIACNDCTIATKVGTKRLPEICCILMRLATCPMLPRHPVCLCHNTISLWQAIHITISMWQAINQAVAVSWSTSRQRAVDKVLARASPCLHQRGGRRHRGALHANAKCFSQSSNPVKQAAKSTQKPNITYQLFAQ